MHVQIEVGVFIVFILAFGLLLCRNIFVQYDEQLIKWMAGLFVVLFYLGLTLVYRLLHLIYHLYSQKIRKLLSQNYNNWETYADFGNFVWIKSEIQENIDQIVPKYVIPENPSKIDKSQAGVMDYWVCVLEATRKAFTEKELRIIMASFKARSRVHLLGLGGRILSNILILVSAGLLSNVVSALSRTFRDVFTLVPTSIFVVLLILIAVFNAIAAYYDERDRRWCEAAVWLALNQDD